jgi:hypothetical protein
LVQSCHVDQEGKDLSLVTFVNIAEAVLSEGLAEAAELERSIAELEAFTNHPTTVVSFPRLQA